MPNSKILPNDFILHTWDDIKPYYDELVSREINSIEELMEFIDDYADVSLWINEDNGWRYIRQSCDTQNEGYKKHYEDFVDLIQPEYTKTCDIINKKINACLYSTELSGSYNMFLRSVKRTIEIFREENIPLYQELDKLSSKYGEIMSQMTISHDGEELTLKQAQILLKSEDRNLRKEIFDKTITRKKQDRDQLNEILDQQIILRTKIAQNTGFENYADYQHFAMERFDYTVQDVTNFCENIKKIVVPLAKQISKNRSDILGIELKPYDFDVSLYHKASTQCYKDEDDLVAKVSKSLNMTHEGFGNLILRMKDLNQLDLMTRKGKRQGGYCSFMDTSDTSFVFMNVSTDSYGLMTMIHEAGHAIHHYYTNGIKPSYQRFCPSEICEIGSMAQEFLTLDKLDDFFINKRDYEITKLEKIIDEIMLFPRMAKIDSFQQWLYRNPNHSHLERSNMRKQLYKEYSADLKYTYESWLGEYEESMGYIRQGQLHIYECPFYYVEYGIASLASMALWKQYLQNPIDAVHNYIKLIKAGYTKPMPEIFAEGGIKFDFSKEYIIELMTFMQEQLELQYKKLEE